MLTLLQQKMIKKIEESGLSKRAFADKYKIRPLTLNEFLDETKEKKLVTDINYTKYIRVFGVTNEVIDEHNALVRDIRNKYGS